MERERVSDGCTGSESDLMMEGRRVRVNGLLESNPD